MDQSRNNNRCGFYGVNGRQCQEFHLPNAKHCFWHDSTEDKKGADIKDRLEERARTGVVMEGFELKEANLENLNLVSHLGEPYQLINSNLSRANLHKAHLYKVDLSGSSLLKADLSHANLHRANLSNSNLLGVNFKNAHLEHVIWGSHLYQEQKARELPAEASRYYEEAEEVARNIRRQCEQQGMHGIVGHFFYREVVFRRMQMPRFSMRRLISRLVDLVSKYGESPLRVVCSSGLLVMCCSLIYFCTGIQEEGVRIQYQPAADAMTNLQHWSDCLYFSVVTFTTLGYGDLTPFGWSRVVAAIEAFTGSFSLALFVVLFVKKMTR